MPWSAFIQPLQPVVAGTAEDVRPWERVCAPKPLHAFTALGTLRVLVVPFHVAAPIPLLGVTDIVFAHVYAGARPDLAFNSDKPRRPVNESWRWLPTVRLVLRDAAQDAGKGATPMSVRIIRFVASGTEEEEIAASEDDKPMLY